MNLEHPILQQSFATIEAEVGQHHLNPQQWAIARRVIHATADFDYLDLLQFSPGAIAAAISSLQQGKPIVTDVRMVQYGIQTLVGKTFHNPIVAAVATVDQATPGKTLTETGLERCLQQYPDAIYVFGNAPTALIALCKQVENKQAYPSFIVGAPVGFVSVLESKQALAQLFIPHILVSGRKGGSPVASAIINALLVLAKQNKNY